MHANGMTPAVAHAARCQFVTVICDVCKGIGCGVLSPRSSAVHGVEEGTQRPWRPSPAETIYHGLGQRGVFRDACYA